MKILGVGIDLVENIRIKKLIKVRKFLNRIFTKEEIDNSLKKKDKTSFLAKRFASKEAFSKALGSGFRNGLNFIDISIINDKKGKPYIKINNKLKNIILKRLNVKKFKIFLSISDEKNYSIAIVIIEKK
tara:strand:- start:113 stop:499 length:387 start_codon:yes stop_codon:yes gene_type:complete